MSRSSDLPPPSFMDSPKGWPAGLEWPPPMPALGPGISRLSVREIRDCMLGTTVPDARKPIGKPAQAGIFLWFGHMEASHEISQEIGEQAGSYWHGLMHRREPDHANAAYWFRRVGNHPIFAQLRTFVSQGNWKSPAIAARAGAERKAAWDPYWMNDCCEEARNAGPTELVKELEVLQWVEYYLLLQSCLG